jgi:hypothetical protein
MMTSSPRFRRTHFSLSVLTLVGAVSLFGCGQFSNSDNHPVAAPSSDVSSLPCPQRVQTRFDQLKKAQMDWYSVHGAAVPTAANQSQYVQGSGTRAVLLVHGFISSPAAMADVQGALTNSGYTVYTPLLTGFGSDARGANAASSDDWRQAVSDGVNLLKLCYSDITVVSHSLGATIVTDEVEHHGLVGISKFVFLAPYFKLAKPWPEILTQALTGGLDEIDVGKLQQQTGVDPYSYLPLPKPKPGDPPPFLPLIALHKVVDLQNQFQTPASVKLGPTYLAFSQSDQVIDGGFAANYLTPVAPGIIDVQYPASESLGHSIETRSLNPHFDEMMQAIEKLIGPN